MIMVLRGASRLELPDAEHFLRVFLQVAEDVVMSLIFFTMCWKFLGWVFELTWGSVSL